jgi:hypothetical protein
MRRMAGVSYGLLTGVPLVALAIVCAFVLQRRSMVRSDLLVLAIARLLRSRQRGAAVELCLRARAAPAAQLALCLMAVRLPRRPGRASAPDAKASSYRFPEAVSTIRAALVQALQADQRQPTLVGIVSGLTGALAAFSAVVDPTSPRNGPIVLAAAGLLAAGFVGQRWRSLHLGIALGGEAIERMVLPEEELDAEGRAASTVAAERCRESFPRLAALLEPAREGAPEAAAQARTPSGPNRA